MERNGNLSTRSSESVRSVGIVRSRTKGHGGG
jgi:hypothetical protein